MVVSCDIRKAVRPSGRDFTKCLNVGVLIAIALLAFRGNENGVYEHIKRALKHGANKKEILEALETAVIPGGAPTFGTGLRALMRIEKEEERS